MRFSNNLNVSFGGFNIYVFKELFFFMFLFNVLERGKVELMLVFFGMDNEVEFIGNNGELLFLLEMEMLILMVRKKVLLLVLILRGRI